MWMCCNTGGAAEAEGTESSPESSRRKYYVWRDVDEKKNETVDSLRVPSLVEVDGAVFAVAEAQCTNNNESFTGIASELLTWSGEQTREELNTTKLKTQVLEECPSSEDMCASQNALHVDFQDGTEVILARPTTVVEGSEICMLAGIYNFEGTNVERAYWGILLLKGNVSGVEKSEKRIHWHDVDAIPSIADIQQNESLTDLIGGGGSGVKMEDGTLLFPVEGIKSNGAAAGTNTVSLIIYSTGNGDWKLSKDISADGCSDPSLVKLEKDKLIMMTACDDGRRRVYESGDKGES
ncbi:trans-sialidase, putative, partial [Trypanosoma cruzi marinkellei]